MSKVIALAVDTEFTSFDKIGGDLITAGFVEVLEDYTLGREKVFYSRPRGAKYFTEKAQKVHGFSYFKASTFPDPRETAISMLQWMAPFKELFPIDFINHGNGKLDYRWIEQFMRNSDLDGSFYKAFNGAEVFNTIKMSRDRFPGLENYKLSTIANHLDIELDHHEALSDARAAAKIFIYCKNNYSKPAPGELF